MVYKAEVCAFWVESPSRARVMAFGDLAVDQRLFDGVREVGQTHGIGHSHAALPYPPGDHFMRQAKFLGKLVIGFSFFHCVQIGSLDVFDQRNFSVILRIVVRGTALERLQVLFPGEKSYVLDLKTWEPRTPPPAVIEAKDDEPAEEPAPTPVASSGISNDRNMLLMLSSVALVIAFFALRAKQKPQS